LCAANKAFPHFFILSMDSGFGGLPSWCTIILQALTPLIPLFPPRAGDDIRPAAVRLRSGREPLLPDRMAVPRRGGHDRDTGGSAVDPNGEGCPSQIARGFERISCIAFPWPAVPPNPCLPCSLIRRFVWPLCQFLAPRRAKVGLARFTQRETADLGVATAT